MADPISIMAIGSMGLSAAGAGVSAFGAAEKADATSNMALYKAGVAKANAQIADQNAQYEYEVGGVKGQQYGLEGAQKLGQITSHFAASGIDVTSGSHARARTDEIQGIQQGEGIIAADSARKAYGYQVQGMDFSSEGKLDTMAASNVQAAKGWDIASSILGGASSVADKWMKFGQSGIKPFASV